MIKSSTLLTENFSESKLSLCVCDLMTFDSCGLANFRLTHHQDTPYQCERVGHAPGTQLGPLERYPRLT